MSSRRETKRRLASGTAKYVVNPVVRGLFRLGLPAPGTAILETIGRAPLGEAHDPSFYKP